MDTIRVMVEAPLMCDNNNYKDVYVTVTYSVEKDEPEVGYKGGICIDDITCDDKDVDISLLGNTEMEEMVAEAIDFNLSSNTYNYWPEDRYENYLLSR